MHSMQLTREEREKQSKPEPETEGPTYPWGLELHLDQDALSRIPEMETVAAGEMLNLAALAKVKSVETRDVSGSDTDGYRTVTLQIQHLGVAQDTELDRAFEED